MSRRSEGLGFQIRDLLHAQRGNRALVFVLIASAWVGVSIVQHFGHKVITNPEFGFQFRRDRIRSMVEALPAMIQDSPESSLVFAVGTSEVESGFDPVAFDREYALLSGKSSVSWNLGLRGRGGEIDAMQSAIIQRVAEERKPSLIFNQIALSRTTTRLADHDLELDITEDFSIYFDRSFGSRMGFKPISSLGAKVHLHGLMMDGFGVDTTFAMNFYGVKSYVREAFLPEAKVGSVFPWRDLELHVRPAFEASTRGFFNWSLPDSKNAYDRHVANQLNVFARRRIQRFFMNCCFGGNAKVSESSLLAQVEKGKVWGREMGVPVVHVLLPTRRKGYESIPLDVMNQEFRALWKPEWGDLLDLTQDPDLARPEHFLDLVHFRPSGQEVLARRLAERAYQVSQRLKR